MEPALPIAAACVPASVCAQRSARTRGAARTHCAALRSGPRVSCAAGSTAHVARALLRAAAPAARVGRGAACGTSRAAAAPFSRAARFMAAHAAGVLPFVQRKLKSGDAGAPAAKRPKSGVAALSPLAAADAAAAPLLDLGDLVPATMLARPRRGALRSNTRPCSATRAHALVALPCAA